jgi:hypothetical protein
LKSPFIRVNIMSNRKIIPPHGRKVTAFLMGYFSRQVVEDEQESRDLVKRDFATKERREAIRQELEILLSDNTMTARRKVNIYLDEDRSTEERAQARLQEIWNICLGENGVLKD